jgi:ribose transport system permease protein
MRREFRIVLAWLALLYGWMLLDFSKHGFGHSELLNQNALLTVKYWGTHWGKLGILTVGMLPVLIIGGIDLSVASLCGLLSILLLAMLELHVHWFWASLFILALALVLGSIHGILISKLGLAPFIVTIAASFMYQGLAFVFVPGGQITYYIPGEIEPDFLGPFISLAKWEPYSLPSAFVIFLCLCLAVALFLRCTKYGRSLYTIGCNKAVPNEEFLSVSVYALCSGLVAVAAIVSLVPTGSISYYSSEGQGFNVLAIALIGGCSLRGGRGSVLGILVGLAIYRLLNGLVMDGGLLLGAVILIAVILDRTWLTLQPGYGPRMLGDKPQLPDYLAPYQSYLVEDTASDIRRSKVVGSLFVVAGAAVFSLSIILLGQLEGASQLLIILILGATFCVLFRAGYQILSKTAVARLAGRTEAPILYLRSFGSDSEGALGNLRLMLAPKYSESSERSLAKAVYDLGPLLAVGKPGEGVPPLGAARFYVEQDHWQEVVTGLVKVSSLVIMRIGQTRGFIWEFEHLKANYDPEKVLIYIPLKDRDLVYSNARRKFQELFNLTLPDDPLRAFFLAFKKDWQPYLLRPRGPSFYAKLRNVLTGSRAAAVREAIGFLVQARYGASPSLPPTGMEVFGFCWFLLSLVHSCDPERR